MILRERENVLGRGAERGAEDQLENPDGSSSQGGQDGSGGRNGNSSEGDDEAGSPAGQGNNPYGKPEGTDPAGNGQGGNNSSGNGGSNAPQANSGPGNSIPDDIPNGSDDDVVARQIREAAMQEKDPKLRAKLWEEYRKYKKN